mmetsp:Transcript_16947/g.35155  ORF Transcript_16947/g.35155 Transcript_16947/m.35155 type:complete len:475 (-) Transcript_16947:1407-2831(-)
MGFLVSLDRDNCLLTADCVPVRSSRLYFYPAPPPIWCAAVVAVVVVVVVVFITVGVGVSVVITGPFRSGIRSLDPSLRQRRCFRESDVLFFVRSLFVWRYFQCLDCVVIIVIVRNFFFGLLAPGHLRRRRVLLLFLLQSGRNVLVQNVRLIIAQRVAFGDARGFHVGEVFAFAFAGFVGMDRRSERRRRRKCGGRLGTAFSVGRRHVSNRLFHGPIGNGNGGDNVSLFLVGSSPFCGVSRRRMFCHRRRCRSRRHCRFVRPRRRRRSIDFEFQFEFPTDGGRSIDGSGRFHLGFRSVPRRGERTRRRGHCRESGSRRRRSRRHRRHCRRRRRRRLRRGPHFQRRGLAKPRRRRRRRPRWSVPSQRRAGRAPSSPSVSGVFPSRGKRGREGQARLRGESVSSGRRRLGFGFGGGAVRTKRVCRRDVAAAASLSLATGLLRVRFDGRSVVLLEIRRDCSRSDVGRRRDFRRRKIWR